MALTKLATLRIQKNITQKELAEILPTDVSNYSRKERGLIKIYDKEWEKLAIALEVSVEEIKENIDLNGSAVPKDEKKSLHYNSSIKDLQKYILLLEKQNQELREEIKYLLTKAITNI
ncbi:helix-turn-helix protein [Chryseobacterium sp. 52]|uniref:helix-turn-helix domain-containing protein n=1 Tax=Chryseobacterium sp. 52 TaxID=2035213 RepID=UPI000C173BB2|nr:helix-turn-helix transcriptional regulator [Chryseobacterium sp. 52]PIF45343.1 helix-turn-helix protein [Chryseobacterium sp. 52]